VPQLPVPQFPSRGADPSAALNTGGSPATRAPPPQTRPALPPANASPTLLTAINEALDALERGARAMVGGHTINGSGYFYAPTVLVDVPRDARVIREEIFGPVAPVLTFTTEREAVQLANSTEYGLASYVFTSDTSRALRMADCLEFGMMGLNVGVMSNAAAPFGGVKHSGLGREGAAEGIAEYTYTQYIGVRDPYVG